MDGSRSAAAKIILVAIPNLAPSGRRYADPDKGIVHRADVPVGSRFGHIMRSNAAEDTPSQQWEDTPSLRPGENQECPPVAGMSP